MHFVTILRRLEIVRDRADATGDRNLAGRVRERMRVIAEEAAMLDSDRFERVTCCKQFSIPTRRRAWLVSVDLPPLRAQNSLFFEKLAWCGVKSKARPRGGFI